MPVSAIAASSGRATGVVLDDGSTLPAGTVVPKLPESTIYAFNGSSSLSWPLHGLSLRSQNHFPSLGFDILPGEHPIIPVMIGDAAGMIHYYWSAIIGTDHSVTILSAGERAINCCAPRNASEGEEGDEERRGGEGAGRASGPFVGLTAQTLLFYSFAEAAPGIRAPSWKTVPSRSTSSAAIPKPSSTP